MANSHSSQIIDLPSRSWVKGTAVKDNNICSFLFLFNILKNTYKFCIELADTMILIVKVLCLRVGNSVVKN